MKILITGGCGFVGSNLAIYLKKSIKKSNIYSLDNLFRLGSKFNKNRLDKFNIKNFKIDISEYKKIKKLPKFDLIIDCCAEPAIEISKKDPDRVIDTNFIGTFNILKKCLKDNSKIIFLSSSRVYSINSLKKLINKKIIKNKIKLKYKISEKFDTTGVKSLYGFTKLSSEELIKEISYANKVDYIINRFGVITGPWQFGKQDQGFVSLWVNRHLNKKKLKYIGFGGYGNQVRDVIHIDDVCKIISIQIKTLNKIKNNIFNIGVGPKNTISLKDLTGKCQLITNNKVKIERVKKTSIYDIPYFVTNNSKIYKFYKWQPKKDINSILFDIYTWLTINKKIVNKVFK